MTQDDEIVELKAAAQMEDMERIKSSDPTGLYCYGRTHLTSPYFVAVLRLYNGIEVKTIFSLEKQCKNTRFLFLSISMQQIFNRGGDDEDDEDDEQDYLL